MLHHHVTKEKVQFFIIIPIESKWKIQIMKYSKHTLILFHWIPNLVRQSWKSKVQKKKKDCKPSSLKVLFFLFCVCDRMKVKVQIEMFQYWSMDIGKHLVSIREFFMVHEIIIEQQSAWCVRTSLTNSVSFDVHLSIHLTMWWYTVHCPFVEVFFFLHFTLSPLRIWTSVFLKCLHFISLFCSPVQYLHNFRLQKLRWLAGTGISTIYIYIVIVNVNILTHATLPMSRC